MADKRISDLTALTGANVADTDLLPIVDTSATETKKITFGEFKTALDTATGFVRITGDTMTGALDVQSTITADGLTLGVYDSTFVSTPLNVKSDASHFGLSFQENSGNESWQIGVNANGDLSFHNSADATPSVRFDDAGTVDISGDIDVDGTTNLDVVDIDGATQIDATVTVGVDDTGYDVKFFGATAGAYMLWDESADDLILGGAAGLSVNSTALVTGVLTTTAATVHTGGITMPDNAKAIFGAGSDLQIYHASGESYVEDVGAGDLSLRTNGNRVMIATTVGETMGRFEANSYVKLYYDNAEKLATTATGIDVTGTVVADGLTVNVSVDSDSVATIASSATANNTQLRLGTSGNDSVISGTGASTGALAFKVYGTERLRINSSGNVGIGTTPSAWASAYKVLQIGSASSMFNTGSSTLFVTNGYIDSGYAWRYQNSSNSSRYTMESGGHAWYTAPSGIAGDAIGFTQAMTIDSSGNVGIGVVPDAWSGTGAAIQLEGTGHLATANQYAYIGSNYYYNGGWKYTTSSTAAQYRQDSGTHQWLTAASGSADAAITWSESMRIDSSGNVLVGHTSAEGDSSGTTLYQNGQTVHKADGAYPLELARYTSNGELLRFRKDGATAGSIGVATGPVAYIVFNETTSDNVAALKGASGAILPSTNAGADKDGTMNLGSDGARFENLYLSGGVVFGDAGGSGTPTANTLDSYEEGTWTPSVGGNTTYTTQSGTYTKVGRQVVAHFSLVINTIGTGSTYAIAGLPFTSAYSGQVYVGYFGSLATAATFASGYINATYSSINLVYATAATTTVVNAGNAIGSSTNISGVAVYFT